MISLLLDSGAFSAFTRKKSIDLKAYTRFILENEQHFTAAINLDVINPKDPEAAAEEGWSNFLYMREQGVKPIPVFHAREDDKWLARMLDKTDYIGLSGTSLVSPSEHKAWYGHAWDYGTDAHGRALAKFHAFGDGSPESLATYPWYSADCATAQMSAGLGGQVIIDHTRFQALTTNRRPNAPIMADDDPEHTRALWVTEIQRRGIDAEKFIKAQGKITQTSVIMLRFYLNCIFLIEMAKQYDNVLVYNKPTYLMDINDKRGVGTARVGGVKLHFVISDSMFSWGFPVFAMLGIENLLISYFYCAPTRWPELRDYMADPIGVASKSKYWPTLQEYLVNPYGSK